MTACQSSTHPRGSTPLTYIELTFHGAAVAAKGTTFPGATWTEIACQSCASPRTDAVRADGGTLVSAEMLPAPPPPVQPAPVGLDAIDPRPTAPEPFKPDWAVHPGEIVAELLDEQHLTAGMAAKALGWPVEWVNQVAISHHDITPEMAADLARVFQVPTGFWLRMQQRYTTWRERQGAAVSVAGG